MPTESIFRVFEVWPSWPFSTSRAWGDHLSRWLRDIDVSDEGMGIHRGEIPWGPSIDVYETPEGMEFHFDLPGVNPATVEITALANMLVVKGHRERPTKSSGAESVAHESSAGPFARQVALSSDLDGSRAKATHNHGVLVVTVPRKDEAKPRTIPIESN